MADQYSADSDIVKRFIALFIGNERGYGYGRAGGQIKRHEDNKWTYMKGYIGWKWGLPGVQQFLDHLNGKQALGIGVILDDGTTRRGELDIDVYNLDYIALVKKIEELKLPLVLARTKSGGVRGILFLEEGIEARLVQNVLHGWKAQLGYGNNKKCEVFPKQVKLASGDDGPSWTFLPYGPTFGVLEEQCGLNGSGGSMDLPVFVSVCENKRISREEFMKYVNEGNSEKDKEKSRKATQTTRWSLNSEWSTQEVINDIFIEAPVCLTILSRDWVRTSQHETLVDTITFLKKKYSDNWSEVIIWLNANWLKPMGNVDRLHDMIRDHKDSYNYRCSSGHLSMHCDSRGCRRKIFGVGRDGGPVGIELGGTIIDTAPRLVRVNIGEHRVIFTMHELLNHNIYREKCAEYGAPIPPRMKPAEWDRIVNSMLEEAPTIEPTSVLKKDADVLETVVKFLGHFIINLVRKWGNKYLEGDVDDPEHVVRVYAPERRIYFKRIKLTEWCMRNRKEEMVGKLRIWLNDNCTEHKKEGVRGWWRHTFSISYDVFDEETLEKWGLISENLPENGQE